MNTPLRMSLVALALAAGGCTGSPNGAVEEESSAFTARKGVDYAFARPSLSALKSEGYTFVARYLSYDNSSTHGKILFTAEAEAPSRRPASTSCRTGSTPPTTRSTATTPASPTPRSPSRRPPPPVRRPIGPSTSASTSTPRRRSRPPINAYLDGVASVIGRNRTGAYGGYYVIKRAFDAGKITWGWQTYAWSGGQWDPRAQFRQTSNGITAGGS